MEVESNKPMFSLVDGKEQMVLNVDLPFHYQGKEYVIPAGFVFDGASIPRFAWSFIGHPFDEHLRIGACIHDWIFTTHCLGFTNANHIFMRRIRADGERCINVKLIFAAVAGFGYPAYKQLTIEKEDRLALIRNILKNREDKEHIEMQIKIKYYARLK